MSTFDRDWLQRTRVGGDLAEQGGGWSVIRLKWPIAGRYFIPDYVLSLLPTYRVWLVGVPTDAHTKLLVCEL